VYEVHDCLADVQVTAVPEKRDADRLCADRGGNKIGYYVFPILEKPGLVEKPKAESVPRNGALF
jgi:hypothetical protein